MKSSLRTTVGIAVCSVSFFLGCMQWRTILPLRTGPVELGQSDRPSCPAACRLQTGELMVVFPAGDAKDPRKTLMIRVQSRNGGKSWTSPRPILNTIQYAVHPSLTQLRDNRLVLVYGTANLKRDALFSGFYLSSSTDGGETFSEPRPVVIRGYDFLLPFDSMVELDHGGLLLPVTVKKNGGIEFVIALISKDQGQTWGEMRSISNASEKKVGFFNPSLHRLENGRLLCVMETSGADDFLYQSVSDDSGKTWTPPLSTGIQGSMPDWIQSFVGTLFLAYDDFWPRGISLSRSYQSGTTWEKETQFYPSAQDTLFPRLVSMDSSRAMLFYFTGSKLIAAPFDAGKTKTPKGFSVSTQGKRKAVLRWNAVPSADYYFVYRGARSDIEPEPGYPFTGNAVATPVLPAYSDTKVDSGKMYFYRVTAVSGNGKVMSGSGSESDPTPAVGVRIK